MRQLVLVLAILTQDGVCRLDAPQASHYLPADTDAFQSPVQNVEYPAGVGCVPHKLTFGRSQLWGVHESARVADHKTVLFESEWIGGAAFEGDDLWVVDARKFYRISPAGKVQSSFASPIRQPRGLAVLGEHLVVAERETFHVVTKEGRVVDTFRAPSRDTSGIASWNNLLLVADSSDRSLYVLSRTGWVILIVPLEFAPLGVASDGRSIWAAGSSGLVKMSFDASRKMALGAKRSAKITYQAAARGMLALPWNMNRQKILGTIEADSNTIRKDQWGQPAVEAKSVTFTAEMYDVQYFVWPDLVKGEIPEEIRKAYLRDGEMLKITDAAIQKAAKWVTRDGKETSLYEILHRAYAYTTDHIYYARGGGWPDAPTALRRGTGTCSPISFVFVAVCRASGLPARFQAGTRLRGTLRDEEFHRWCEVFLPGYGWVPADPSGTGKSPTPAHRARFLGHVPNIDLIMTLGGGGSEFFGWGYNSQKGGAALWSEVREEKIK